MNHTILRCLKKIDQLVEEAIHDHDIDVSHFDIAFAELACVFAEQPEPLRTVAQRIVELFRREIDIGLECLDLHQAVRNQRLSMLYADLALASALSVRNLKARLLSCAQVAEDKP